MTYIQTSVKNQTKPGKNHQTNSRPMAHFIHFRMGAL